MSMSCMSLVSSELRSGLMLNWCRGGMSGGGTAGSAGTVGSPMGPIVTARTACDTSAGECWLFFVCGPCRQWSRDSVGGLRESLEAAACRSASDTVFNTVPVYASASPMRVVSRKVILL